MAQRAYKNVALATNNVAFDGLDVAAEGVKKYSDSVIFYALPLVVAVIKGLSCGAKGLFAKLIFDAGNVAFCRVGVGSLANTLGVKRGTIRVWLRELERRGLITVRHEREVCCYYLNLKYRVGGFIPLLAETMKRRDVGQAYKLVLCSLSYRQRDNDCCWPKQEDIAEDLGLSLRTIRRALAGMKANSEIQIRHRGRNRNKGNKYALTCGAVLGGRVFGANSHRTESTHLDKKRKARPSFKALRPDFKLGGLSARGSSDGFGAEAVFFELVNFGVHEKVARPMAFDQKHSFESVAQAKNNALILRAAVDKRSEDAGLPRPKFNMAGYVVAALNGARREGKIVGTTRLFREAGAMSGAIKIAKARRGRWRPLSDAEFEDRRRAMIRSLELPA